MDTEVPTRSHAARILLVDDDAQFASFVGTMLEDDGYDVVGVVTRATDAPGAAAETAPDLVILDLVMADGDGLTVADWLRADGHEGPILVFSSLWDRRIEEATRSEGYGYVQKADGIEALEDAIESTLRAANL
jgi:DNA-binding response OmpR family regulator